MIQNEDDEALNLDNILKPDEIDSVFDFSDNEEEEDDDVVNESNKDSKKEEDSDIEKDSDKVDDKKTTEVDKEEDSEEPESVGSGKEKQEDGEDTDSDEGKSTSPKHFYSSIAIALKDEGVLPELDDDAVKKIESPEDLREAIEKQITSGLDEKQRRIDEALNIGVEPNEIKKYEDTLSYLSSIKESDLEDEGKDAESLRKSLIFNDFLNRGYTKERANREVNKSLNAGSDIEDAKEALKSNKEFISAQYNEIIDSAKEEEKKFRENRERQAETIKESILNDKDVFDELGVDKSTRQKITDNILKPVFKDKESGQFLTAIQKYQVEHNTEFLKNIGLIFTLTDGFKDFKGLVKGKVKKEVRKGLRELEHTLNNTSRDSDGSLQYVSGVDDSESYSKDWTLDV